MKKQNANQLKKGDSEREKNNERKRKGRKIDGKGKIINKHNENITVNDK